MDKNRDWTAWHLLFVVEFVLVLWPPFYNKIEPVVFGMPFFYWYQMVCVLVGALITGTVYFCTRPSSCRE